MWCESWIINEVENMGSYRARQTKRKTQIKHE